ncbi:MAG: polymer-forming cytoskeletal protein, partial [Elusimicrobiota bacterium]
YVLEGYDPVVNTVASGLREIKYSIDGSGEVTYIQALTLTEGIHTIKYYAIDNIGNPEVTHTFTVNVDNTPPETTIVIGEPKFDAFGTHHISPKTPITLTTIDPRVKEVASDVKYTEYRVFAGTIAPAGITFSTYFSSFTVPQEGINTIEYRSVDNVLNTEQVKSYTVFVTIIPDYALVGIKEVDLNGKAQVSGNIRSNGEVELNGNTTVTGDVYGKTVELDGKAQVIGKITQNAVTISSEPVDLTPITTYVMQINDNNKIPLTTKGKSVLNGKLKFKISGKDTLNLSTGTYYFTKIDITGESTVNIAGNVNIICTGEVKISGKSKFNAEGSAYKLIVFIDKKQEVSEKDDDDKDENEEKDKEDAENKDDDDEEIEAGKVKVDGNSKLVAIVYAPYSEIDINGKSNVTGNLFGHSADINGGATLQSPDAQSIQTVADKGDIKSSAISFGNTEFKLGEVYSYPNPAKNGQNPTFHIEVGLADKVEIMIFNIAAELIHTTQIDGWRVTTSGLRSYYEYTWPATNNAGQPIASGVYIYYIKAEKSGYTPITVIKKCAIIR